jgi:hypothetical protein
MAKRTTRKAAKKSGTKAKKKGTKKAAKVIAPKKFKYFCASGTCKAQPRNKHLKKRTRVELLATGTNATLDFRPFGGSPFLSGVDLIHLMNGVTRTEQIGSSAGTFKYKLSCGSCAGGPANDPSMIVDP